MKARKAEAHENHERWLVSYADFITLLFAFFVVMFASSQVDKKKAAAVAVQFQSYIRDGKAQQQSFQTPGEKGADTQSPERETAALKALSAEELAPVKTRLEQDLLPEIREGKIGLSLEPRGLVLSLRESALFPSGRDSFIPDALPTLAKIAQALRNLPDQPVRLEGHTDNVPIDTPQFPSNWELSAARAVAVMEVLAGKLQIGPERLAVAGYADFHPVASNDTPQGRSQNRRVDIVVLSRSAAEMEPEQRPENTLNSGGVAAPSGSRPVPATPAQSN